MGMSDYSDLEKEIREAPEPKVIPAGTEVKARIILVNSGTSEKNDARWYSVVFDVPSEVLAPNLSDFFWELADRDKIDPKQFQKSLRQFRTFAESFGIDYSRPFMWEDDLVGKEGWIIVGVKKSDEYGDQNTVKKYVAGK